MAEYYISKKQVVDLLRLLPNPYNLLQLHTIETAIYFIKNATVADVQPVIYCKDCKYAQNPNDTMVYCTYFECGTMSQNDFCSQGERRVENG